MRVVAIVQARMGSNRLPNKVMKPILGRPMIEYLLSRLATSEKIDEIIVATSVDMKNDVLENFIVNLGYKCFRGSESDVLERYYQAATLSNADVVVRITGDCPFVDPNLVDEMLLLFEKLHCDYLSNTDPPSFPDGLDVEIFTYDALKKAQEVAVSLFDREHVTPYLRNSKKYKKAVFKNKDDLSDLRWTVDEFDDFLVIEKVFQYFSGSPNFTWRQVLDLEKKSPEIFSTNKHLVRNEGGAMGAGQKLWKRAKSVIPGGNMLLSKRADMFLPNNWPSYFSKSRGCEVWDLDGNHYFDMSIMGVGTNILGYGHPEVDASVHATVDAGNMSTLNCPEEVYLAEKLVELHPWADMVRFARSGGEANAIAIRIARAASGKDKVAVCGYHGWHDWYLSVNLSDDKGLDGHLLPGLEPNGVPRNLKETVFPFAYNNYAELESLVNQHEIGVIKMEVSRNNGPQDNFLQKVRSLATDKNIVLIFDECTSGFRETFGGLHKKYGVEPDMAMFGKALGNGYAITATIGRREIMEAAQSTFISSTFWTERIGPAAALKTLEVMERLQSWNLITATGLNIRDGWQKLADKHGLLIEHWGLPALTGFTVKSEKHLFYKTLITQEMLKKGYLSGNCVYVSIEHSCEIVNGYFEALDPVFKLISECENNRNVLDLLDGPVCHSGFRRLN